MPLATEPARPRYRLTLEALPSRVPVETRLRAALKRLLRSYALRCVEIGPPEDVPPPAEEKAP